MVEAIRKGKRHMNVMISAQCKAGRAMLGWSQDQLAAAAGVSKPTIADFERGSRVPMRQNIEAMRRAMEEAGLEFLDRNGAGRGVRFRDPQEGENDSAGEGE